MNVIEAKVRRATKREGVRCCEVEVQTDDHAKPQLLAFFGSSRDNDFDMLAIVENDANREVDWFDNNLHQAFSDVSINLFETSTMKTDWGRREMFKEQVLTYPGVRADLAKLLDG